MSRREALSHRSGHATSFYSFSTRVPVPYKWRMNGCGESSDGTATPTHKSRLSDDSKSEAGEIYSGYARSDTTSKLELFIVCRLGEWSGTSAEEL